MQSKTEKVIYVDGFKIRNTLDTDFTVLHRRTDSIAGYAPKYFIPHGEIWIDNQFRLEADFFVEIDNFLIEHENLPYLEARELAKTIICPKGPIPNFRLKEEFNEEGQKIVNVDGSVIRKYIDPDFVFGGHEFVYDYVPENEIWLDALMDPMEVKYVLEHEKLERTLMSKGEIYDIAHEFATTLERKLRRDDGLASYPGDADYPWKGLTTREIINDYYYVTGQ
ncbi:MAG: hypothetical protein WC797_00510 [Candidatus Paceibacterota bacterium]|jgi:hypothetical protein